MRLAPLTCPALIALVAAGTALSAEQVAVVNRSAMAWTLKVLANTAAGIPQAVTVDPGKACSFNVVSGQALQLTLRDWLGCEDFSARFELVATAGSAGSAGSAAAAGAAPATQVQFQLKHLRAGSEHVDSGCQWVPAQNCLILNEDESPCEEALRKLPDGIKLQFKLVRAANDSTRQGGAAKRALPFTGKVPEQVQVLPMGPRNGNAMAELMKAAAENQKKSLKASQF